MAKTMSQRGIEMGVFVAHKIYWKEPNLASGDIAISVDGLTDVDNLIQQPYEVWRFVVFVDHIHDAAVAFGADLPVEAEVETAVLLFRDQVTANAAVTAGKNRSARGG